MTSQSLIVYIGLGSNLNQPIRQIRQARASISRLANVSEQTFSSLYRSDPLGPSGQPSYINAVMAVTTDLPPLELLSCLQAIEQEQGRVRGPERWSPRTLDLDLLIYGRCCMRSKRLILPHYAIAERPFVLYPLAEIAPPHLLIPGKGLLKELLLRCPWQGLEKLNDSRITDNDIKG